MASKDTRWNSRFSKYTAFESSPRVRFAACARRQAPRHWNKTKLFFFNPTQTTRVSTLTIYYRLSWAIVSGWDHCTISTTRRARRSWSPPASFSKTKVKLKTNENKHDAMRHTPTYNHIYFQQRTFVYRYDELHCLLTPKPKSYYLLLVETAVLSTTTVVISVVIGLILRRL